MIFCGYSGKNIRIGQGSYPTFHATIWWTSTYLSDCLAEKSTQIKRTAFLNTAASFYADRATWPVCLSIAVDITSHAMLAIVITSLLKQTLPDDVKFQVIPTFLGQGMRLFYDTCQPTRKEVGFAPQVIPTCLGRGMRLLYDTCQPTRKKVGFAPQVIPRLVSWQLGPQSILSHTHIAHYIPIFCVWTSVNRKKEQSL